MKLSHLTRESVHAFNRLIRLHRPMLELVVLWIKLSTDTLSKNFFSPVKELVNKIAMSISVTNNRIDRGKDIGAKISRSNNAIIIFSVTLTSGMITIRKLPLHLPLW